MAKQAKFTVTVEVPSKQNPHKYDLCYKRSFRTQHAADRAADRLAVRHSRTSRFSASRYPIVCVNGAERDPHIDPSVGELGYW